MKKWWEDVLGQRTLFTQLPDGRWQWEAHDLDVRADPNVTFPTLLAARLACAAMIYAFFVMEEVTSTLVPHSINRSDATAGERGPSDSPPTQGSVGGN